MSQPRRKAILVAGMHRSGTSALARVINLLGAELPENLLGANLSNPQGHWESNELIALHNEMLVSANAKWTSLYPIPTSWFESKAAEAFASRIANFVEQQFQHTPLFVIKDPRIALLLRVWRKALAINQIEPHFVLPFRPPFEVASSLARREAKFDTLEAWPTGRGLSLWLHYVLAAEQDTRDCSRTFVEFDFLLDDWRREMARVGSQIGVTWPNQDDRSSQEIDRFLNKAHKTDGDAREPSESGQAIEIVGPVYRQMLECTADPMSGRDVFDTAIAALKSSASLLKDYIESLEADSLEGIERRAAVERLESSLRDTSTQLHSEVNSRKDAENRLNALEASTSWRMTMPIRLAATLVKKGL